MENTTFLIMNIIGLVSFAAAGTVKALQNRLDLFGILVVGIINALGGGIIRDALVNKIPFAFTYYLDMTIAVSTVILSIVVYRFSKFELKSKYFLLIPDAIGLAAFATTGAIIAAENDLTLYGIIILSATTAIGGGISSDLLLGRSPQILKDEFLYASCAIIGAITFFAFFKLTESVVSASYACLILTLATRIIAMIFNLKLPKVN